MRKRSRRLTRPQQQPALSLIGAAAVAFVAIVVILPEAIAWTTAPLKPVRREAIRWWSTDIRFRTAASSLNEQTSADTSNDSRPVLVVGATGKIGRKVVQKLLGQNRPVRALVRNPSKAKQIFGTATSFEYPPLEIVKADLGLHEEDVLDKAVEGCSDIISVMGVARLAKLTDFLPWRVFSKSAEWADRNHPYHANYRAHQCLIKLAEKHQIQHFVRLSSVGVAYSPFDPVIILLNTLLSFKNRWSMLTELALFKSRVPHIILRPGGLEDQERNSETTNLQVDASGEFPYPARVGRSDVAALALAATSLPLDAPQHLTLACRWCGEQGVGSKNEGFATAQECMSNVFSSNGKWISPPPKMKPYGLAVGLFVYTFLAVAFRILSMLWRIAVKILLKRDCW